MRILISVQNYYPANDFGGRVPTATALAEGLVGLGHTVCVVTSSVLKRQGRASWRSWTRRVSGVEARYLGTWLRLRDVSLNPSVIPFAWSQVRNFDLVHILGLYDLIGPVVAAFARGARVPYFLEPAGMLVPIVRSLRLKRFYHWMVARPMMAHAQALLVTSRSEWDEARALGVPSELLARRPNGVDLSQFSPRPPRGRFRRSIGVDEGQPLVLYLGRIDPVKSIELLIEAFSQVGRQDAHLAIVGPVGDRAYLAMLKELVSRLDIVQRVHFAPELHGPQKIAAYVDADIFALTSLNENWGLTAGEAIAAGTPVLVTRTCGVAEVMGGRGGLVVEYSIEGIRQGLQSLLSDANLYSEMKASLPALAAELSWEHAVRTQEQVYREALSQRRRDLPAKGRGS